MIDAVEDDGEADFESERDDTSNHEKALPSTLFFAAAVLLATQHQSSI